MPLYLRLIAGALLVLVGLTLLTVGVLGHRSRLPRNRWIGIRSRATLRSEAAFRRAHEVAAAPAAAAGVVALAGGALLLAGGEGAVDWIVLGVSAVGALALAGFAGQVGDRAAALLQSAPVAACAGACPGCDLVRGCRDRSSTAEEATRPSGQV